MPEHRDFTPYAEQDRVKDVVRGILYTLEGISLEFAEYKRQISEETDVDLEVIKDPGALYVVETGGNITDYSDPMGDRMPELDDDDPDVVNVVDHPERFYAYAKEGAKDFDGAVFVSATGDVHPGAAELRDFLDLSEDQTAEDYLELDDDMGTRHRAAAEATLRPWVPYAVAMSEETGSVTVFRDGDIVLSYDRNELGGSWRSNPELSETLL